MIYLEQERLNLPGLLIECKTLAKDLNILEMFENTKINYKVFKRKLKDKIKSANEKELKDNMKDKEKCNFIKTDKFGPQPYFFDRQIEQVRTKFRYRTQMTQVKFNFKNDKKYSSSNWKCDSCESGYIESQSHLIWCQAYSHLREGKNLQSDKDLIEYITKIMNIREELNLLR